MGAIASQITSPTIVYSIVYSDADQRKHQSSASLTFVRGIHRGPVNSPHKWPVARKMFPFDDVIMHLWFLTIIQKKNHLMHFELVHTLVRWVFRSNLIFGCMIQFWPSGAQKIKMTEIGGADYYLGNLSVVWDYFRVSLAIKHYIFFKMIIMLSSKPFSTNQWWLNIVWTPRKINNNFFFIKTHISI